MSVLCHWQKDNLVSTVRHLFKNPPLEDKWSFTDGSCQVSPQPKATVEQVNGGLLLLVAKEGLSLMYPTAFMMAHNMELRGTQSWHTTTIVHLQKLLILVWVILRKAQENQQQPLDLFIALNPFFFFFILSTF